MNQILYIKDGKGNGTDINQIIRFFAIVVIIFGLAMVSTGSYAVMQKNKEKNAIPDLSVQDLNDGKISIIVVHDKEIDSIVYSWNGEETEEIRGTGRNEIEEIITAKSGTNTLKVTAVDIEGKVSVFENVYNIEDRQKPELDIDVEGTKIKITATDETEIAYITYRWNEEEEVMVEAENELKIVEEINIKEGTNKLTIVAVDANNNMKEEKQEFKGLTKPKIEKVEELEDAIIVRITHEKGIGKIKSKYNGIEEEYGSDKTNNLTEINLKITLNQGDNHISLWAYSTEDTEELAPVEFNEVITYNP